MIIFVGHGKLNFNLTEKSLFSHYRHSKIRLNTHFLTMFRLQPAREKQAIALVTDSSAAQINRKLTGKGSAAPEKEIVIIRH
jgi:hypothetical protein